jgi:hypothetical protein
MLPWARRSQEREGAFTRGNSEKESGCLEIMTGPWHGSAAKEGADKPYFLQNPFLRMKNLLDHSISPFSLIINVLITA